MKEETCVFHIFKSLDIACPEAVPWPEIKSHFELSLQEVTLCKTIIREELEMRKNV